MDNLFFNSKAKTIINNINDDILQRNSYDFHKKLDDYEPTRLINSSKIAKKLGFANVWVKDESNRFDLPAFKIMGASWAVYRLIEEKIDIKIKDWNNLDELRSIIKKMGNITLVTATDGNHGRGVARIASWFGFKARIFMPKGTVKARSEAIRAEGADVIIVDGDYDEAVVAAEEEVERNEIDGVTGDGIKEGEEEISWLIQDTAWKGYEKIPAWIVEGYSTIFWEIDDQLNELKQNKPDLVIVQVGVGSLASTVIQYYRNRVNEEQNTIPKLIGVEPESVACAMESVKAGKIVTIPGPYSSVMAGMNCGTISSAAWPYLKYGIDAYIKVSNERAFEAMRILAGDGIISGETGCAGVAGLLEIHDIDDGQTFKEKFGLDSVSNILVISTEGATDPEMYNKIINN
ncbi:MAG: diaminopropionate ammonia-lyase [archaeon]|nr:diaminopropionate ammonia-lyase [archaeon]